VAPKIRPWIVGGYVRSRKPSDIVTGPCLNAATGIDLTRRTWKPIGTSASESSGDFRTERKTTSDIPAVAECVSQRRGARRAGATAAGRMYRS